MRHTITGLFFFLFLLITLNTGFCRNDQIGLVPEYLILGTFPCQPETEQPLMIDYLKGETELVPFTGLKIADKKWGLAKAPLGVLNFRESTRNFGENSVAYAHVYLKIPKQKKVKFLIGSDDGVAVFVNGVLIHENHLLRGITPDEDEFTAVLAQGWNRVLCKVFNGHGGFGLALRILNEDNSEIHHLEFSANNPVSPASKFVTPAIPPKYIFRNLKVSSALFLAADGKLNVQFEGFLFNLGNQNAAKIDLRISGQQLKESSQTIPVNPLPRNFNTRLPLKELIENVLKDSQIHFKLSWNGGKSEETLKIDPQTLLDLVFQPVSLPVKFMKTSTRRYGTSKIVLPKILKKAPLAVTHRLKTAQNRLNGKVLEPLSNLPHELPYNEQTVGVIKKNPEKFTLESSYFLEHETGQPISSQLVVYAPQYHIIREAIELSRIFENEYFKGDNFPAGKFLQFIQNGEWKKLSKSLQEYDAAVGQFVEFLQQNKIHFVGNSHIDLAWLWPWTETVEVCRETFENVINLMEANPDFTFTQSQAQAYAWIEKYHPALFKKITEKIKSGKWTIVNGMWTEPDSNLPSGEAFVRQILYGQMYFKEKFGITTDIAWTPDTFGYAWTLPQIYKKAGFNYFVTNKIWWNDVTKPKNHLFWWEAPDGTRILTFLPQGYQNNPTRTGTLEKFKAYYENTQQSDFMILYGHGDHGGGPTHAMVGAIDELSQRKVYPKTVFSTPDEYFSAIKKNSARLPVLKDEMYLEYHRGCYTTQAKTKKYNRQMECLLETAEKFASFANIDYPRAQLDDAWKRTLFNQFHDILPGSSIPVVYEHALASYDTAQTAVNAVINQAVTAITKKVNTNGWGTPFVVFNPLSWGRKGVVEIDLPKKLWGKRLRVTDSEQWVVKSQSIGRKKLLIELTQEKSTLLPAVGYETYHIQVGKTRPIKNGAQAAEWQLKNKFFEIVLDEKTGNIASIKDLQNNREVLAGPGNELQFFEDIPQKYDAWNIGYTGKEWRCEKNPVLEIVEEGPVRASIRVTRTFGKSKFVQDIIIYRDVPTIDFRNRVDWHEAHVLVKAAFPLTVANEYATYEIPYGWIQRPTVFKTAADSAKYEVSAHKWIDLTDAKGDYGVSLLNDSKYGFDVQKNIMRITLLRSPKSPDPEADMGEHTFTYSLYPHAGDWQTANTYQFAYELNYPCIVQMVRKHRGQLPKAASFVQLSDSTGVTLSTVKNAEEKDGLIIRLVEYHGRKSDVTLTFMKDIQQVNEVNLLEMPIHENVGIQGNAFQTTLQPFEIKSFQVSLKSKK